MFPQHVHLDNGTRLSLEKAPLGKGGQGAIFRFDGQSHPGLRLRVAKLYLEPEKARQDEARIRCLAARKPNTRALPNPHCLVWPEELLFDDQGQFIGFILPLIGAGVDLEILCTANGTVDPRFQHFLGPEKKEWLARHKVALNLVTALEALELAGDYVSTDLKPQNVLICPKGLVYLIDLDALQIRSQGKVLFPCTGYTDEYPPPEFYQGRIQLAEPGGIDKSWERFSLAVILYRLLLNIHPFMGRTAADGLLSNIKSSYFPNGRHRRKFSAIPAPHNAFGNLSRDLQQLFLRAFDAGTDDPARRPTAMEWVAALKKMGLAAGEITPHQRRNLPRARARQQAQRGPALAPPPPAPTPVAQVLAGLNQLLLAQAARPRVLPPPRQGPLQGHLGGIWGSMSAQPPYLLDEIIEDPTPAMVQTFQSDGLVLAVLVLERTLSYHGPAGPVPVGKRIELLFARNGQDPLSCNFAAEAPPTFPIGRLFRPGCRIPNAGHYVRDIYQDFTFRFWGLPLDPTTGLKQKREACLAIPIQVPPQRIASLTPLAPAAPIKDSVQSLHNSLNLLSERPLDAVYGLRSFLTRLRSRGPVPLSVARPLHESQISPLSRSSAIHSHPIASGPTHTHQETAP